MTISVALNEMCDNTTDEPTAATSRVMWYVVIAILTIVVIIVVGIIIYRRTSRRSGARSNDNNETHRLESYISPQTVSVYSFLMRTGYAKITHFCLYISSNSSENWFKRFCPIMQIRD